MLKSDVIERAHSEWNSPYLMVPKKDSSYRFVIDFRRVNILDSLGNAKYLSSLDIKSAYWEVPLEEASRPLTAFSVAGRGQLIPTDALRSSFGSRNLSGPSR
jgi:hypothetical protein